MPVKKFKPTPEQKKALDAIFKFIDGPASCFILKGSAGTGKTTLISKIVEGFRKQERPFVILAPTGRAARVVGARTNNVAHTIHSIIYSLSHIEVFEEAESANDPGIRYFFPVKTEDPGETLFIVDEASMVGDKPSKQDVLRFGSGSLLTDLIEYLRLSRKGRPEKIDSKIIFIGDSAQLPPVRESLSPALSPTYIEKNFKLECEEFELKKVLRQESGSKILENANAIRNSIDSGVFNEFNLKENAGEIEPVNVGEALSSVTSSHQVNGNNSVLITLSNARALELNRSVRGRLWDDEQTSLQVSDVLLVNQNSIKDELYNGDLVTVVEVRDKPEVRKVAIKGVSDPVQLFFRQACVGYLTSEGSVRRIHCLLLENLLDSRERELSPIEQRALLVDFRQRHPKLKPKTSEFKLTLKDDPWFNALRVKYGYAMTCHKAQGGEWETVVVDFSDTRGKYNEEFFRWAYTAVTRTRKKLLTISAPNFSPFSSLKWNINDDASSKKNVINQADLIQEDDSDWERMSFVKGQEKLFQLHCKLRNAWQEEDILIEKLDHLQFCERYHISRNGCVSVVEYSYKSNQSASQTRGLPGGGNDPALTNQALSTMQDVLYSNEENNAEESEFVRTLIVEVKKTLEENEIPLISYKSMEYRVRLEIEYLGKRSKIDFVYDGTPKWTHATEVGGTGSSHGVIELLQKLLN